jgi:hypothetical protein
MGVVVVRYKDTVEYELADDPTKRCYFVFGVRKSGSSILNNMLHAVADMNGIRYVDVAGVLFDRGLRVPQWQRDPELTTILRPGNLFGGFRNFPLSFLDNEQFEAGKKVLLVRDPRDALVSEYFSNAYSHSVPQAGEFRDKMLQLRSDALRSEIDAYVLKMAPMLKRTLKEYFSLKRDDTLLLLKYEDVITEKRRLINDICRFFGWTVSDQQVNQILGWADVIPSEERPTEFIRKVLPGDHLEKLSRPTVDKLNELLKEEMTYFGYR